MNSDIVPSLASGVASRRMGLVRWLMVLGFTGAIANYLWIARGWPLIHDTTVIHYVSFLMDRGWAPYRQIGDMNMPGAYLFESWALHLFGSSDAGWRLYDLCLCGLSIAAMVTIARRYDWLAGFVAGGTFVLVHASEGPMSAGQRDQLMAVLLLAGYAFCFESVRREIPWFMLGFGLCCAMAASVKPTLLFVGPVVFGLSWMEMHRRGERSTAYCLWTLGGYAVAGFVVLRFLVSHQALAAFWFDVTKILPHYAGVAPATWSFLFRSMLQVPMFVYIGLAIAAALIDRNWGDWECKALLVGVAAGLFNYFVQRKGYGQHRYTTVAFALTWGSVQIFRSLRGGGYGKICAVAGLAFVVLVNIPRDLQWAYRQKGTDDFSAFLERDLEQIGSERLQGQIQCLDIVDGCLNALYHLKIVQSTGSTGDLLLFLPESSPVVEWARVNFMKGIDRAPPKFFVLSNQQFAGARTFHKVDYWPEFAAFLDRDYSEIAVQREFGESPPTSHLGMDSDVKAYRILMKRLRNDR